MGRYNSYSSTTLRDYALGDPAVPQALKDLQTRILPEKKFDELRELLKSGAIDPLAIPENYPLMSPLSQIVATGEAKLWLPVLFESAPEKFFDAVLATAYYGPALTSYTSNPDIEKKSLLTYFTTSDTNVADIITMVPGVSELKLLQTKALPRYNNSGAEEPLFHHLYNNDQLTPALLDRFERETGGTEFLMIRNSQGETLFHRIAAYNGWSEDENKVNIASWMLQKQPQLVNEPDRFGWTPLDRLVARTGGKVDSAMGRLLIASGAQLNKQIAPQFNLASALEEHSGKRLEKAQVRKLSGPAA